MLFQGARNYSELSNIAHFFPLLFLEVEVFPRFALRVLEIILTRTTWRDTISSILVVRVVTGPFGMAPLYRFFYL